MSSDLKRMLCKIIKHMNLYDPKMLFIYFFGRTDLKMKETNRAEENVWNSLEKF